ncbi:MAG TPA: methyltransferase domain-containing protein [Acetobacteraceae bacterium]|nr:methyltransferase domain-containing protein [Acetobacteraceae bacterium]
MEQLQATADATALTARIAVLIDANRPVAARHLLSAVRRLVPPSAALAELAARVAVGEGRLDQALAELDAAVTQDPEHASLRKCRAELRLQTGDTVGALADAAEAVILDRTDPAAKALLGVLLLEHHRAGDAIACLGEAVAADAANPAYRQGLAAAQEASGDTDAALATLSAGIAAAPWRVDLRNAAILVTVRRRDFTAACQLAEAARVAGVADACSFGLMGHALSSLGRHTDAADAYAEALKLGPDDPYVRHLVAASGILPSAPRAPVEYLRAVFDGYADRFEAHLISLGYRIPGLIHTVLARHPTIVAGDRLGPALDLGCGTGLAAVALSDLPVAPLVGLDVSPRMLQAAAAKQLYAELHEADLMRFLAEDTRRWRLILAADVLIYFGALAELLAAAFDRLEPSGWFVFSLEELLPDHDGRVPGDGDWALQRQGRYAHSIGYVIAAAGNAGFAVRVLERQTVRFEADAPVAGIFVVLERAPDDC